MLYCGLHSEIIVESCVILSKPFLFIAVGSLTTLWRTFVCSRFVPSLSVFLFSVSPPAHHPQPIEADGTPP